MSDLLMTDEEMRQWWQDNGLIREIFPVTGFRDFFDVLYGRSGVLFFRVKPLPIFTAHACGPNQVAVIILINDNGKMYGVNMPPIEEEWLWQYKVARDLRKLVLIKYIFCDNAQQIKLALASFKPPQEQQQ